MNKKLFWLSMIALILFALAFTSQPPAIVRADDGPPVCNAPIVCDYNACICVDYCTGEETPIAGCIPNRRTTRKPKQPI